MKKKILTIIALFALTLTVTNVKADFDTGAYNGKGHDSGSSGSTGGCDGSANCQTGNNSGRPTLQISLWYIDSTNGSWTQIGNNYYIAATNNKDKLTDFGIDESYIITVDGLNNLDPFDYKTASQELRKYFGYTDNPEVQELKNENLKSYLNAVTGGDYTKVLTKDTIVANSKAKTKAQGATKGYRVIIEPVFHYINTTFSGNNISPKNLARHLQNNPRNIMACSMPLVGGSDDWCDHSGQSNYAVQSQLLFTEFWDVGIEPHNADYCRTISTKQLADKNNGCGFNIIDIGKYVNPPKCYSKTTKSLSGDMTCKNYDAVNEASFTEEYSAKKCTTEEKTKNTNTEYGKKIKETSNCTLYCIESAYASFPGGIKDSMKVLNKKISPGSYFAWPAKHGASIGMQMYMKSELNCRIVTKNGKTCSSSDITQLQSAATGTINKLNFGAKLKAGTNKEIDGELVAVDSKVIDNYSKTKMKNGLSNSIKVTRTVYFEIANNKNRIVNKGTGEVKDGTSASKGQLDRLEGVISLKNTDDITKRYSLKIYDVRLGDGNQFGSKITNYVCYYRIDDNNTCECPPDTALAGRALTANDEETCLALQKQYCNSRCLCPTDSSKGHVDEDITAKINEKLNRTSCKKAQDQYCYTDRTCKKPDGTEVDIYDCIQEKKHNGKSQAEAIKICEKENGCGGNDDDLFCKKSDGTEVDIYECVQEEKKSGKTPEDAVDVCNKAAGCDDNPNVCIKDGKKIDISSCIDEKMANGLSEVLAVRACKKEKCPDGDNNEPEYCKKKDGTKVEITNCVKEKTKKGKSRKVAVDVCSYDAGCDGDYCTTPNGAINSEEFYKCVYVDKLGYGNCWKEYCPGNMCKETPCYYCEDKKTFEKVDISTCVDKEMRENKLTLSQAKIRCSNKEPRCKTDDNTDGNCSKGCYWISENGILYKKCDDGPQSKPYCGKKSNYCINKKCSKYVVYRIIDLDNPFPENNGTDGKGYTLFTNIKDGRKPGYNWYHPATVKDEILNARGVTGSQLYSKTPLYTIVLTPSKIKEIRNYNKQNDYSDFNLDCKAGSSACISEFLHTTIYELIDRNKSVANCYNITKDEAGFNACYNNDN